MSTLSVAATLRRSWAADLDPATLYSLLKLRVEVFVVEQACPYPELDGRDLEPRTRHYWLTGGTGAAGGLAPAAGTDRVLGCLRLLKEPDGGYRVGRLCVEQEFRGRGLSRRLMDAVLAEVGDGHCLLDAQTPYVGLYAGHGFVPIGEAYDWDGIEHVPMRRSRRELAS
ncbi:MAG TPA: GNAT family N-acetyltransferase [Pseudonocardia sp.]